jgi:Uma2 family endonuclease
VATPAPKRLGEETFQVPASVRFPVELTPPEGFDPARVETWPAVEGRLEWVAGRLRYMPPCGDRQQDTVADVVVTLGNWTRAHPEFVVGTGEAGMHLGEDTRGADAAIWRRADLGPLTGGFRTVPPLLAVEVAGRDERERELREKARWYFRVGVRSVWIVLPEEREVVVMTPEGETRHVVGERLPSNPHLPALTPGVDELFVQVTQVHQRRRP